MHSTVPDLNAIRAHRWWKSVFAPAVFAVPAVCTAGFILALYYTTHPHPTAPGLFLTAAQAIERAGYGLPMRIPYYTTNGLPFAYPPLAFYLIAVLKDITPFTYPQVAVFLTIIEYLLLAVVATVFARTLFRERSRWHPIVASVLIVATPGQYFWHIQPSGCVRLLGFLLLIGGLTYGLRLFRDHDKQALGPAVILFAATILSHPVYTAAFGMSYLVFYVVYDQSRQGLLWGSIVAVGGLLVTAPWWGLMISRHGVEVFLGAASTRGGLGPSPRQAITHLVRLHGNRSYRFGPLELWTLGLLGVLYELTQRRWELPVWLGTVVLFLTRLRFTALIEALLAAVAICEVVLPAMSDHQWPVSRQTLMTGVVGVLLLGSVAIGGLYATEMRTSPSHSATVAAENWLQTQTPPDATVVSYTDVEDVAFFSQRQVPIVPWGAEWDGPGAYAQQQRWLSSIGKCHHPACLSRRLARYDLTPTYVMAARSQVDVTSFSRSPDYRLVYQNRKIVIFKTQWGNKQ